jgi:hypothetical protein
MSISRVAIEVPIEVDATATGCRKTCPGSAASIRVIAMLEWALEVRTWSATTMIDAARISINTSQKSYDS